jgi:hypothetical protein
LLAQLPAQLPNPVLAYHSASGPKGTRINQGLIRYSTT